MISTKQLSGTSLWGRGIIGFYTSFFFFKKNYLECPQALCQMLSNSALLVSKHQPLVRYGIQSIIEVEENIQIWIRLVIFYSMFFLCLSTNPTYRAKPTMNWSSSSITNTPVVLHHQENTHSWLFGVNPTHTAAEESLVQWFQRMGRRRYYKGS